MERLRALLFFGMFALCWFGQDMAARAHAPFASQVEKLSLPDGQTVEVRLLHGDGIFSPDPIRVLIVGADGRLLARSHRSQTMVLSCSRNNTCRAYDVERGQVLEIDPSAFREGPVVPYSGEGLGAIESGDESWGFRIRPASLTEQFEGELILARSLSLVLGMLFVAGISIAFSGLVILRRSQFKLPDVIKILAALMLLALSGIISMILGFVSPVTDFIFFGSIGVGIVFALTVWFLHRTVRIKPPSPSLAA